MWYFTKFLFSEIIVIKVILGMCIFTLTSHNVQNLHVFFNISTKVNYLKAILLIRNKKLFKFICYYIIYN